MEIININKDVFQNLDDNRKLKLREKIKNGELSISIIDTNSQEQTEAEEGINFSQAEEPKEAIKTSALKDYENENKSFLEKLTDKTIEYAKIGGSAIQDTLNFLTPIGEVDFMGKNYDNPITGVIDRIEDKDLPIDAYNKINKLANQNITLFANDEEGKKTYNENLAKIIIDEFGFDDLQTSKEGKYYAVKGDEKIELNNAINNNLMA